MVDARYSRGRFGATMLSRDVCYVVVEQQRAKDLSNNSVHRGRERGGGKTMKSGSACMCCCGLHVIRCALPGSCVLCVVFVMLLVCVRSYDESH